ncbi:hypothetical protein [Clostridium sp. UBA6640]|uniref:hypothetical protein n=1 Tax=Clostridium sp. UBA6640 TaxID=1946370 RepID=UPI0025B952E4|nr:hypothetical protein [Clostridium sp. UBA6640]
MLTFSCIFKLSPFIKVSNKITMTIDIVILLAKDFFSIASQIPIMPTEATIIEVITIFFIPNNIIGNDIESFNIGFMLSVMENTPVTIIYPNIIKTAVSIHIERNLKDSSLLLISSFDTLKYIIEDKDVNNNTSTPRINLKIFLYICISGLFSTFETIAIKYIKIHSPIIDILNNLK